MEEEKEESISMRMAELNETFQIFTEEVLQKLDQLLSLRETVQELCEAKIAKRQCESERKRKQRDALRQDNEKGRVSPPKNVWQRDDRLKVKYLEWAHIAMQFGLAGEWRLYFQFLADDWNNHTYFKKPIAKISNRLHRWDNGLRIECTWTDMFGSERGILPKTAFEIGWWEFRWHFNAIVSRMRQLPLFKQIQPEFLKAIQVMLGDLGEMYDEDPVVGAYNVKGYDFSHDMHHEIWTKVPDFRLMALHVLQSFRRGISRPVDPELELVRLGKMCFLEHASALQKKVHHIHFLDNLKKGETLDESMEADRRLIKELGFWEEPS